MFRRLSTLVLLFLLLSFVGEAFHHHGDGQDHPDCSVCVAAVHHKADTGLSYGPPKIQLEYVSTLLTPSIVTFICKSIYTPALGRAPPV